MTDHLTPHFQNTALLVILRVLRRRKMLKPADLTDLRLALHKNHAPEELSGKIARLLEETVLEREERRETPRKQD